MVLTMLESVSGMWRKGQIGVACYCSYTKTSRRYETKIARRCGTKTGWRCGTKTGWRSVTTAQMAVETATSPEAIRDAKPFKSIPGPRPLPLIGTLYTVPGYLRHSNSNQPYVDYERKYGPIVREQFGPKLSDSLVSLYSAEGLEALHRNEGKYPRRLIVEAWQAWRDDSGYARGILIEDGGPDWKRMRVLLDKQMLRPRHVSSYAKEFGEVSMDMIEHLRKLRDSENNSVQNIGMELFNWSLESIGTVVYETRFGVLTGPRDPETVEFIQSVRDMFETIANIFYFPRKINLKLVRKHQLRHDAGWAGIFKFGKKQIDLKCAEMEEQVARGEEVTGFLSTLIASGTMSIDEIYGNISELMAAAVDTTSNTMQWVIYEMSMRQDIQETLRDEILSVVPRGSPPTAEHIQKMPYLRAFLKEILRLYPIANADTRITNDDIVLCGYHIPKDIRVIGYPYVVARNPEYYPDPLAFKPERWIRSENNKNVHTFAWLPFGYGTRMCIGRRVAELEIHILTSLLLQEFTIHPTDREVNPPATRPLIVPERPLVVQFLDRK